MSNPKIDLHALGERLAREEDALLEQHPLEPTFRGSTPRAKARPRVVWAAAASGGVVMAAAIALLVARSRPLDVTVAGGGAVADPWVSAPMDAPVPIHFSDGTEVVLEPDAHARVLDVTRSGAHVVLESGRARVSVVPNRGGEWTFTAGPFTVDVKGTRFELAWSPQEQRFTLALIEGKVLISGCAVGERRPLLAGETLSASCLRNEFQIERAGAPAHAEVGMRAEAGAQAGADADAGAAPEEEAEGVRGDDAPNARGRDKGAPRAASPVESWQSLARASRFKEALARAKERGFDAELAHASRDDLVLLGDVARLSGDASSAILAYERVRKRAPGSDAAANAAFSMGRVYFDQREAYGDAARWFATYRSERGEGPLARDAMGRQMEALARAGDRAAAARIAEEYLAKHPKGPHAALARSLRPEAN